MNHGRIGTYNSGCRCNACRRANRLRRYRWDLRTGHGEDLIWVDAQPVLDHIAELKASGWTYANIGREIGKGPRGIHHLIGGYNPRGRLRRETAAAIMGLDPIPSHDPDLVDEEQVRRLVDDPNRWRRDATITRAERLAAADVLGSSAWKALGFNGTDAKRVSA